VTSDEVLRAALERNLREVRPTSLIVPLATEVREFVRDGARYRVTAEYLGEEE
jgi:hypothetical protein